jgi:hypothetical protein
MNSCIRIVCVLIASLIATHALSQDLSGWSDKTVCRQTMETEYQGDYLLETKERQLDCREFYPDFNEGSNLPENISFARIDPTSISNYQQLLESRITINRFRPWFTDRDGFKGYQLYWGGYTTSYPPLQQGFGLTELYWRYVYKNKTWSELPNIYDYTTNFKVVLNSRMLQTPRLPLKITSPAFQKYIAFEARKKIESLNSQGVILDWWHNNHKRFGNETKQQIQNARFKIAQSLRQELGPQGIVMGNTNWDTDFSTHDVLNGTYLELWKKGNRYSRSQYFQIENLLRVQNDKLQQPKILAAEFWKVKTHLGQPISLNHSDNYKIAKLFASMVTVIADNGYVTYIYGNSEKGDGNVEKEDFDYDFYHFDLGKPISAYTPIAKGIGIKEFEQGVIGYNITSKDKSVSIPHGTLLIPADSGLLCRYTEKNNFDCHEHTSNVFVTKYDRTSTGMEKRFKCLSDYAVANGIIGLPSAQEIETLITSLKNNDYYMHKGKIVKAGIAQESMVEHKKALIRLVNFEGSNKDYCAKPVFVDWYLP